jgi:hypothetical protein
MRLRLTIDDSGELAQRLRDVLVEVGGPGRRDEVLREALLRGLPLVTLSLRPRPEYAVACPRCGAAVEEPCRHPAGRTRAYGLVHRAREEAGGRG